MINFHAQNRKLYIGVNPCNPEVKPMGRGRPTKCPYCKSAKSISKGFKYRANGKAKDRKCGNCGKRYLVEEAKRTVRTCPNFACPSAGC
jgi:DNA-directed RNA polymerase subunit RPC12/RpoP